MGVIPQPVKHRLIQLAKVVVLTAFFTFLWIILFYNEPTRTPSGDHTHDDDHAPSLDKIWDDVSSDDPESVEKTIESLVEWILKEEWEHNSAQASDTRLKEICGLYSDVCNKTVRNNEYTPEQRLFYQWIIVYLINKLDRSLAWWHNSNGNSIRSTLDYIRLYEDNAWRRGSAGHDYIKFNTSKMKKRSEYLEVATHELGHIVDLGVIKWTTRQKDSMFTEFWRKQRSVNDPSLQYYKISRSSENVRKSSASRLDFVSWYAMKWVYEDFAESFNLYLNHYDVFKKLASSNNALNQKFQYLQKLLWNKPLQYWTDRAQKHPTEYRGWDTTTLAEKF